MPAERVAMRQAREIIHLKFSACVPTREIARRLGIAASTVRETLRRFESAGLGWPLPDDMTDGKLETALYTNRGTKQGHRASGVNRTGKRCCHENRLHRIGAHGRRHGGKPVE